MGKKQKGKADEEPRQVNQYDKIIKENIEDVIPNLMREVLKITAIESEEIPDDIQHTKERKPDVLKKVTDEKGDTFIVQIEFQVANEEEMIYRMAEYFVMLQRKYKLPVRQFVIYIGRGNPTMVTSLDSPPLQFSYKLIAFKQLDYKDFLLSDKPQEVVLSVLADFKGSKKEVVLEQILARLEETSDTALTLQRYVQQLRVLVQLRNLEDKLETVMDSIAPYISEERDALYMRGVSKTKEKVVTNLLTQKGVPLSLEQVAEFADVSVSFVKKVQRKISSAS
jgi:hypothetical protein